jgi:hypothetical protein
MSIDDESKFVRVRLNWPFKAQLLLYVPPALILQIYAVCP